MSAGRLIVPASAECHVWFAARDQGIGASEIAAVLGLSTYGSAYNLFWTKVNGDGELDDDADVLYWGRALEAALADRFTVEHPEFTIRRTGLWQSNARSWQLASPDRNLCEGKGTTPVALWEGKTAGSFDGWGDEGTDDIPVAYRAQVLQQADVMGVDAVYVSLLVNGRHYREYVVHRDDADLAVMRTAGERFWQRVRAGRDNPEAAQHHAPPVDGHHATTDRLKRMHPLLDDTGVVIPADLIQARHEAAHWRKQAEEAVREADNRIRELMGDARYGVLDDALRTRVATRIVSERKGYTVKPTTVDQLRVPMPKIKEKISDRDSQ